MGDRLVVFLVLLYILRDVLLPFVAGMVVAYLLDPWPTGSKPGAHRERWRHRCSPVVSSSRSSAESSC